MKALIRWLLFICAGLPIQALTMLLYPLVYLYWRIAVFKEVTDKQIAKHNDLPLELGLKTRNDGKFLDNSDDHGAFTHYNFLQPDAFTDLLDDEGNFLRRRNEDGSMDRNYVSGDVVIAFSFAALFERPDSANIKLAVKNYLKYLGTRSYDKEGNDGDVSNRCNNFGVNYCPDSDTLKLGQPAAGPQFYTNSALFATAYNLGFQYKMLFWAHWLLMGGWYWAFAPVLYSKDNGLWYVRDMTMKALYVHLQTFGPKWWIVKPMNFITKKISTHKNQLFYAMLGEDVEPGLLNLPKCMHTFFSQNEDASSKEVENGRVSAYIKDALLRIWRETKFRN